MKLEQIGSREVHPVASIFPVLDQEHLEELANDIREHGLREPIVQVWVPDGLNSRTQKPLVLDGRNRLRACELAKVPPRFAKYEGPDDTESLLAFVRSRNLARRHLNESQRAIIGARALALYEAAAKERQATAARATNAKRRGETHSADVREASQVACPKCGVPPGEDCRAAGGGRFREGHADRHEAAKQAAPKRVDRGKASEKAADTFGVSARLIEQAKRVEAKATPEVKRAVERGELKVGAAAELVDLPAKDQRELLEKLKGNPGSVRALKRQHERRQQAEELAKEPAPPPTKGPFRVLVADFPWPYDARNDDATHRGTTPYAQMSIDEGCLMGGSIQELAHDDSVLWFWVTNQHMREAFDLVTAWGFQQKTILTWCKDRMGLGNYLRNQTEHCLLCVRGKPVLNLTNQTTILHGPVREHSRKPESFYELVEQLTPGSKIELFCREARPGWAAWGAEVEKFARSA